MDLGTIIGVIMGLGLILGAILLRQGGPQLFFDVPSMMITFGGAIAATLINFPLSQVIKVFDISRKVLMEREEDPTHLIELFVNFTRIANRQGLLALQDELKKVDNEFFKRGVQLVIDGADQDRIRSELETEIVFLQERHTVGQETLIVIGTFCPAFGMIGTVMGLIMMLANLEDQSQIASGMAVALLTTFYGAVAAYLFLIPMAGKLKRRSESEIFIKQVIIQGVLSLQSGELPSVVDAKLKAYLAPKLRNKPNGKKVPGQNPAQHEKSE